MQINYRVSSLSKDPKRRCPDTNKLEKLVGWKPRVSFEEGLKRTIGWFSQRK
jgi:nucleoside-diphosphate-sugar epimerase